MNYDTQFTWYVKMNKIALKSSKKKMMKKMGVRWQE